MARDLESHSTLVTDPIIVGYLNRVEQRIVVHSSLHGCFVVKMIKDIEPNAYSLPGGFIYVTAGLVLISSNEAELAAALAHETSHVTAQHYTRINRQRQLWGTLSLLGSPVGYLFRRSLGPLLTARLFRSAELEADRWGVKYQNAAGYDPNEFVQLLRNAFADEQSPTSFGQRLFDTHPSLSQRTRHLNLVIRKLPRTASDSVVDTGEFHEIKSRSAVLLNLSSDDPFGIEEP